MKVQNEPLLKLQTKEYIDFIKNFTDSVSIMTKNFFVVVSYSAIAMKVNSNILGSIGSIFSGKGKDTKNKDELDFEEKKSQLEERVSVIQQGLSRCGIKSAQLGTEEVVEVFYKVFNPGEQEGKIDVEQTQ